MIQDIANRLMAQQIEKAGLRLEDNFRVADKGLALTHKAAKALARSGFSMKLPSNESIKHMGIDRTGGVWHPLSEENNGNLNLWASASAFVGVAQGWVDDPNTGNPQSIEVVRQLVASVTPNVSVDELRFTARYDDRALLRLIGLVQECLFALVD